MQSMGIQMRISDLLFALQKRWKIIVSLTIVGFVFGMLLSAMSFIQSTYQTYSVEGSFIISSINSKDRFINGYDTMSDGDFHLAQSMVDTVLYMLTSDRLMNEVINDEELLGVPPEQLAQNLRLSQYLDTPVVEMKFTWNNADVGIRIWEDIVLHANELLPETLQLGRLYVVTQPEAIATGMSASRSSLWIILTLLGFMAGVGFAVIEFLMHPTLNNVRDAEALFGLETLGVIPLDQDYLRRNTSLLAEDAGNAEIMQDFSAAAYILRNRLGTKEQHHCFYVTSATNREGRTTVAANLAIQLSDMEHSTLLIDFDTHNPNLGAQFLDKVDYSRSLNAVYRGDATLEEAIITLTGHLDLLPMVLEHHPIPMDSTVVDLIEKLKGKYEYVILDAPPVGVHADTLSLNQVASTVVYVVGYDTASLPEIQSSLEKLDKSGIRVLGCVINGVQSSKALLNEDNTRKRNKKRNRDKSEEEPETFQGQAAKEQPVDGLILPGKTEADSPDSEGTPAGEPKAEEKNQEEAGKKASGKKEKKNKKSQEESGEREIKKSSGKNKKKKKHEGEGAAPHRNVLEDAMERPAGEEGSLSNSEALDGLLRIGFSGGRKHKKTEAAETDSPETDPEEK